MSTSPSEPEFLDQSEPQPTRRRGRALVLVGAGVLAAGVIGAGAWGITQLMGGGPGAASALPADTLLYAGVDLDPSAEQKIEAIKTIRKFPALEKELGLGAQDDLRRWAVDLLQSEGECEGLDYSRDVEPWMGDKAAVAMVRTDEAGATPVVALQVTDEDRAADGIAAIYERCDGDDAFGSAFRDGYLVVAPSDDVAEEVVARAEKASLADDSDYQSALEKVGDLGIVTLYLAKEGPADLYDGLVGPMMGDQNAGEGEGSVRGQLEDQLKDFEGAAGTVRFHDGGVELAFAASGLPSSVTGAGTTSVADLPETTIATLGFALPEGWVSQIETSLRSSLGDELYESGLSELELATGLRLPEDVETVLGDGLVLALDGRTDFDAVTSEGDLRRLKAGIRLEADEADVRRVVTALHKLLGVSDGEELLRVEADGDRVAVGFDQDYLGELVVGGDLGETSTFKRAVAEPEKANAALYVDFDAENWLAEFLGDLGDDEAVANAEPLDALGLSAWQDGDDAHVLLRLSTD